MPAGLPARRYIGSSLKLSPDGKTVVVGIADDDGEPIGQSRRTTWMGDLRRGTLSQFAGEGTIPIAWTPDGRYVTLQDETSRLVRKAADGAGAEETIAELALLGSQGAWTPDGRMFVTAGRRILTWPSSKAVGLEKPALDTTWSTGAAASIAAGHLAAFSPDGNWVTYPTGSRARRFG